MADKKENNKPIIPPKSPRGNYQVWVILATVAVIFGVIFFTSSTGVKEKDYDELKQMIRNGDVRKVVLVPNRKYVEVTLTPEAIKSGKYETELNNGPLSVNTNGPHFVVKVVDPGNFDQEFRKFKEE